MSLCRRTSAAAVLAVLTSLPALAAPRPWVEVRSPNFTVLSDAGEGSARDVAWQFEQARAAFSKLWAWARPRGGKPFVVFAARDEATLRALAPEFWEEKGATRPATVHVTGRDRNYLLLRLDVDTPDDVRATPYFTLYATYASILIRSAFHRDLPHWLHRGLSELYGNTRVRNKDVLVGRVIPWHMQTLASKGAMPLAQLFAVDRSTARGRRDEETDQFYATSWILVHDLMFGDNGARAARLAQFVDLWEQGRSQDVALREALGDPAVLERDLRLYIGLHGLLYARFDADLTVQRERFPSRSVSEAESAAARAEVHVAMGRPKEARALIEEAKAANPPIAPTYDAEALLLDREKEEDALAVYQKAADLGSTSFYTHYRIAQLTARGAAGDKEAYARAARSLERAAELNPDYPFAFSYQAEIKSFLGQPEAALALARKAIELEPGGSYHHVAMARVLANAGREQEATASALRGRDLAKDDWERQNAQEEIDRLGKSAARPASSGEGAPSGAVTASPSGLAARMAACARGETSACAAAVPDLDKACSAGASTACANLAWIHASGQGVPSDEGRAAALFAQACTGGEKLACVHAAWLQVKLKRSPGDEATGMGSLAQLCDAGQLEGCTALAIVHLNRHTPQGRAQASALLKKACDGGDAEACQIQQSGGR